MAKNEGQGGSQSPEKVVLDTEHEDSYKEIPKEDLAKLMGMADKFFAEPNTPTIIQVPVKEDVDSVPLVNCLRNEKVIVRYIDRPYLDIHDKHHVFYGGKAENATDTYTTPVDRNGNLVNVLTKEEKKYLEHIMGVQPGYLSVYKATDNFWKKVAIPLRGRTNVVLNLASPNDYIIYKVLLANKIDICPNTETLKERPKATYRYVLVREDEEVLHDNTRMSNSMKASMLLGSFRNDYKKLKYVVTVISGRSVSEGTKLEFLQNKAFEYMSENPTLFIKIADDPYFDTKVMLIECVEKGIIRNREGYYYYDGKALSHDNADPTLDVAANYINLPSNQEIKFSLEAKLKALKGEQK